MKGIEAKRAELLTATQWHALDQLSALPQASVDDAEERLRRAAEVKGRRWLEVTV